MFDDVNEDIVVAPIGIVGFHIVSILLGETIVAFDTGAQFFQSLIQSRSGHAWPLFSVIVLEVGVGHPAETAFGVLVGARQKQLLRIVKAGVVTREFGSPVVVFDPSTAGRIAEGTPGRTRYTDL